MEIHVVKEGETLYSIARQYGVSPSLLALSNGAEEDMPLVLGQTLVVQIPEQTHTVQQGESIYSIAERYGTTAIKLWQNNIWLGGREDLYPGQIVVISWRGEKVGSVSVSGYAYPFIGDWLMGRTMPYISIFIPFTYGFSSSGELLELNDQRLIDAAKAYGAAPYMHLSTLTEEGRFSNELASRIFSDKAAGEALIENVVANLSRKGYRGLDVDFEFISPQEAELYAEFIGKLRRRLEPLGYPIITALVPKTSANQRGNLYEGHNYSAVAASSDKVLLMTYEWGYIYGPPMAVAPIPSVRSVLDYAVTEMPRDKIYLGIPNYGYDWPLPFEKGVTEAKSIGNQQAVDIARQHRAEIQYDEQAKAPFFYYTAADGRPHEVWFEDARSIREKYRLISEYGLYGAGYWNLMRPFNQNWLVLNALYDILR